MKERKLLKAFKEWYNKQYQSPILYADIDSSLATLPEEKEESKWISVDDALPRRATFVTVHKISGIVCGMYFNTDEEFVADGKIQTNHITHWMPLPEFNPNNQ